MVPYFVFNNKDSRDFNIIVNTLPPTQTVDDEVEYIEVPGRDGYLTVTTGRKPSLEKTITISIPPNARISHIGRWLSGSGKLILFNDPGVYYNTRIQTIRNLEAVSKYGPVSLSFTCQPWAYLLSGNNAINITKKNTKINNPEELSKPLIKIYGTGNVDLIINSNIHKFNINGYVAVDSELMESYKDNILTTFTGKFPVLAMGENNITWNGNVTRIEVIPKWRR